MGFDYVQLEFKDDEYLLNMVETYAEDHPSFDTSFVESLREFYEDKGDLTDGQRYALLNIIKKYRMEK